MASVLIQKRNKNVLGTCEIQLESQTDKNVLAPFWTGSHHGFDERNFDQSLMHWIRFTLHFVIFEDSILFVGIKWMGF